MFSVERMNEIKSIMKIKGKLSLPSNPKFTENRFQLPFSSQGTFVVGQAISLILTQSINYLVVRFY